MRVKSLDHLGLMNDQSEVVGHWNPSNGLKMMSGIFNHSEIYDLEGAVLNITATVKFISENILSLRKVKFRISF